MMTAIFEASRDQVEPYAAEHLIEPVIRTSGSLVAVQSPTLDELGEVAIRDLADAYNLPLRRVEQRRPFSPPRSFSQSRGRSHRPRVGERRRALREG